MNSRSENDALNPTQSFTSAWRPSLNRRPRLRGAAAVLAAYLVSACAAPPVHTPVGAAAPVTTAESAREAVRITPQCSWREAILYFVVLDRFADGDAGNNRSVDVTAKGTFHGGDLVGLTRQLDEISSLGATAIWITPVVKNIPGYVTGAGFPDWAYHGYWAEDFIRVDPRFGSEEELATLVAEAHQRGLEVLLDVVYNHVGYGSSYLTDARTRGWLRSEEKGTCGADDLTSCLSGLPDFRTEMEPVATYLMDAHLARARAAGLDGFRLDTVKHVDHPFWKTHRQRTRAELGEDFFLVGEVWGGDASSLDPWFAGDEMDAGFDFGFQGSTLGWLQGRGRTVAFARYLESRENVRAGYSLAHFLSSHDTTGALHQLGGDRARFRLAATLQLTVSGIPTIYYGEEVGRKIGEWPENRSDMPWGEHAISPGRGLPRDEPLREDYRRLIAARRQHRALSIGAQRTLSTDGDLLVFAREDAGGSAAVVALNRGTQPARATIDTPPALRGSKLRDALSGIEIDAAGDRLEIEVPPLEARVLVPLETRPCAKEGDDG